MNRIRDSINATNLAGDAQQTADSLNQAALDAVELQRELNRLQEHLKKVIVEESVSDDDRAVIQKIIETIESINGGATDIEKAALTRSQWDFQEIPRRMRSIRRCQEVWLQMRSISLCRI